MKQAHIYFSGEVQGVFFRQTAKEIADSLKISGYIKNLPDGRVELMAQSDEENINKLLDTLQNQFKIDNTDINWSNSSQQFTSFDIR